MGLIVKMTTCADFFCRRGFESDHGPDDDDGHRQPHAGHGHRAQGKGKWHFVFWLFWGFIHMCLIFFELMSIITICVFAGGGHAAGVLHEQRSVGRVRRPDDSAGAAVDRQHSAPAA